MGHIQKYDAYVGGGEGVGGGGWVDVKPPLLTRLQKFFLLFILYRNAHGRAWGGEVGRRLWGD